MRKGARAMAGAKTEGPLARKVWALGLLVALVASGLMLSAGPAHARTFTVDNTADPGNGTCSVPGCTLREAIEAANAAPGADAIGFNISGSGVKTIAPVSPLPDITETVTIDGYSQPGASPNTLATGTNAVILIQLVGTNAGETAALDIEASNVVVRGLAINRWIDGNGIIVSDGPTRTTGVRIEGNYIGTDASGTSDLGNRDSGVLILEASGTTVGDTTPAARNLISGNDSAGVRLGSGSVAVSVASNKVVGNLIGTQKNGTSALGNSREGVRISGAAGTTVGGTTPAAANTIAFNAQEGVVIEADVSSGNRVLGNSIFSNSGLGVDLDDDGRTANDSRDRDAGPNRLQNFPEISSAIFDGTTIVKGTLESTPSTRKTKRTFLVQFFSNPAADPNEGRTFLGQKRVTTNRGGKASFTFETDRVAGGTITATATGPGGNTSEFSDPLGVATE
jgi:CSLREA domain-containing protein